MDADDATGEDDLLDDGPLGGSKAKKAQAKAEPIRRCIATGERLGQAGMIRFVLDPSGRVVPDLAGRLPGRGMWLSADRGRFKTALEKRGFARAARRQVTVEPDLAERVEALLLRRLTDLIGLARRGGQAVCGHEKTRAAIQAGSVALLLEAVDGATEPREKLARLAPVARRVAVLSAAELGSAFARDHAVHAAVLDGGLARAIAEEAERLGGMRRSEG